MNIYVDETKRSGYVMAAVAVAEPEAVRREVRKLVLPGQRRIHMHGEGGPRRRSIASALVAMPIEVTIYDAGRRYRTDIEARAACLRALVEDLAGVGKVRLVIEQDDSLVHSDRQELYQLTRALGIPDQLKYWHERAYAEPLLSLPDVMAWSWVRSGNWRRRIDPVLVNVRTIEH